jgi:ATP-binding cassette subfamily E protein 1
MSSKKKLTKEEQKQTRIAIVSSDRCKPKKCNLECKKGCPVVKQGGLCIEVTATDKVAYISETLCIGCGICVKRCPFQAITIINLPKNLEKETTHRYGPNTFKLHRLPLPRPGQVLGLVGTNGIGKSTALQILGGKLKPNLGNFTDTPQWEEILVYFRGSELQSYFKKLVEENLKAVIKPQLVDNITKVAKGTVKESILAKDQRNAKDAIIRDLDLVQLLDSPIKTLSGGELQRFAIAVVALLDADVYMFDEPSSYLDVKQRLKAALVVRSLLQPNKFVIVVEHDLSLLDYLSDFVCLLYGVAGAYGVISMPFGVREGINVFLSGFLPTENLRFREFSLTFKVSENQDDVSEEETKSRSRYTFPEMSKSFDNKFKLNVKPGKYTSSEIIVLLGENGTGKTTLINLIAGKLKPDQKDVYIPDLHISFKPQMISPKFEGSVQELLLSKIKDAYLHPQFQTDVCKPMKIDDLLDLRVLHLSGGELQRVAIVLALGTPADIYLIDEPSAYLDSEQRLITAKVIKRFILHAKKTAFVVEHDFIMATYLADRVIVYEGIPAVEATASAPQPLLHGMNKFLKSLEVTFRRDPSNYRPRINKLDSVKDREQKQSGTYFFMEDAKDEEEEVEDKKKKK